MVDCTVDKVLICINRTQAYKQQYLKFKRLPDQSYASLRTHFTAAERNQQEVEDEAAQHAYGGNAQEASDINMQESLTNLAAEITERETTPQLQRPTGHQKSPPLSNPSPLEWPTFRRN